MKNKKINKFSFICQECDCEYHDESFDNSCESECPDCGEWNTNITTKETPIKIDYNKSKFKVGDFVARRIVIMGTETISLGYKIASHKKNIKIQDVSDNEISVHEYNNEGCEVTPYSPCGTSYIHSIPEFIEIVKSNQAEFEGEDEELFDVLLENCLINK